MARIETRFAAMLAAGALDEVRALAARKLDPLLPAMKAHGVPWLIRHLKGEISLDEAAAGAVHGHPPLRQAPGHLVPQSDEGLALGAGRGGGKTRSKASLRGSDLQIKLANALDRRLGRPYKPAQ